MSLHLKKSDILKKTFQYSIFTFLSRILGIVREVLITRFFGVGALSDAFIMSFRLPNFFRHVFAEGAMSASFVPAFVKTVKEGKKDEASGLLTLGFLFFEGIIFLMYIFVFFKTELVIRAIAPGFSEEQIHYAIPFLRILFPFLFIVSSSTLMACALQSVNCFAVPAFGPALWNIIYVASLVIALHWHFSANFVCYGILAGGFMWLLMNTFFYLKYGFHIGRVTANSFKLFRNVLSKFLPCLFGVSIVELNLFVGSMIASFLPKGSVTLLYLASRFMNIPLGVFAVALQNILLAHFSRVVLYAPKRLNFYILEATKLVTWVLLPATLFLMFVSEPLFSTILLAKTSDPSLASQGAGLLITYSLGLLFLSLNKILLSIFYSMKDTKSTTIASAVSAVANAGGDFIGIYLFGAYGIAGAATISGILMSCMCFYFLKKKHKFHFYTLNYLNFLWKYIIQLFIASAAFLTVYYFIIFMLKNSKFYNFFTASLGYWIIVPILASCAVLFLFFTRRMFGVKLHFLNK
jgi:putative peptidoglycan lipid II flippase